jgi:hypothetical protein
VQVRRMKCPGRRFERRIGMSGLAKNDQRRADGQLKAWPTCRIYHC